jgi:hypothetical protein
MISWSRSHCQSSELELSARAEPVSFAVLSWSDRSDCDAEKGPSHSLTIPTLLGKWLKQLDIAPALYLGLRLSSIN